MKLLGVSELLPPSVARAISDKTYERRKQAALEIEELVQQLAKTHQLARIYLLSDYLTTQFANSSSGNTRKGGLLCLAAIAVGLASSAPSAAQDENFIRKVLPAVLSGCNDADARVRYYSLEACYNICKSTRPGILIAFDSIWDVLFKLCRDPDRSVQNASSILNELMKSTLADAPAALDPLASFLPKLVNALTVEDSRQRTFLLGWISLLDALPHADALLLRALPHITPGLLTFLGDEENEVQTAANKLLQQLLKDIAGDPGKVDVAALASSLIDWLAENEDSIDDNTSMMMMMSAFTTDGGSRKSSTTKPTAIRYIQTLVAVAPLQLSGIAASVLHTCLRCLDTSDDAEIQSLGAALNEQLFSAEELLQRADLGSLLAVAAQGIGAMHETARLEALRWTAALLRRSSNATVNSNANSSPPQLEPAVLPALCDALSSTSDRVVQQSVAVLAAVSGTGALKSVLGCFKGAPGQQLLQRRGAAIIEQLCKIMGACNVLVVVSDLLAEENDFDFEFARMMAQAVSLILCTSPQLEEARCLLASAADDPAGAAFLTRLLRGLCFSVTGALSVAFLAGAYILASEIISQLTKQPFIGDMSASVVELSSLVSLLEAPVFAGMRLQLLTPRRCPALLRALYSLLLILPCQGEAFRQLRQRLDCVPGRDVYNDDGEVKKSSAMSFSKEKKNLIDAESLLATFIQVQMRKLSP